MTLGLFFAAASSFFLTDQSYRISIRKEVEESQHRCAQWRLSAGAKASCMQTYLDHVACMWMRL